MSFTPETAQLESGQEPDGLAPLISILLVNWNGAALLPACLDSLAALAGERCEIIVVDNGSTDESQEVLKERAWVRLIRASQNLGFAGGNDLGLNYCKGKYVLLLNNDTVSIG